MQKRSSKSFQEDGQKRRDFIAEALAAASQGNDILGEMAQPRMLAQGQGAAVAPPGGLEAGAAAGGLPPQTGPGGTGDPDLDWLIDYESGDRSTPEIEINPHADNPTSSAFGIGQLIKANREAYGRRLGIDPNTVKYEEQLQMMNEYIKERYGSAKKARKFWEEHGWY